MGLRLFPINDNTITSRSATNMLREFALFKNKKQKNISRVKVAAAAAAAARELCRKPRDANLCGT